MEENRMRKKGALRSGTVWMVLILLAVLSEGRIVTGAESEHGPPPQTEAVRKMETEVIDRVNQRRKAHDLNPLAEKDLLSRIAREYSRRMIRKEFFSHEAPSGGTPSDRIREAGLRYRWVGENLAMFGNVTQPAPRAVKQWMGSAAHRKNILQGEFTHTGVGIWKEGNRYYITQVFMQPLNGTE